MADISNDFTWSFSRQRIFDSCRRQYWYRYYLFWEGWSRSAPEPRRKAYLFSKMMTLPMLVGTMVHQQIEEMLRGEQQGRPVPDPVAAVRRRLNAAWLDSKNEKWKQVGPKRAPPLFEHYYDIEIDREQIARLRDTAIRSIETLTKSDLYAEIRRLEGDQWRGIEELSQVEIGGTPAFVSPDFAFDHGEEVWLIDWKTGSPQAGLDLQLQAYALFAHREWGIDVARLRAFDYFLRDDQLEEVAVTPESLATAEETIGAGADAMRAALRDPENNVAELEDFPATDDPNECARCFFQEVCDARPAAAPVLTRAAAN